jgi:hypothetical protein
MLSHTLRYAQWRLPLNARTLRRSDTSGSIKPKTQRHILEDLKLIKKLTNKILLVCLFLCFCGLKSLSMNRCTIRSWISKTKSRNRRRKGKDLRYTALRACLLIALRNTLRNAENDRLMSEFEANGIERTDNGSFSVWIRAWFVLSITVLWGVTWCSMVQI